MGKHALHYTIIEYNINSSDILWYLVGAGVIFREKLRYPSILVGSSLGFGGYWTKSDKHHLIRQRPHGLSWFMRGCFALSSPAGVKGFFHQYLSSMNIL